MSIEGHGGACLEQRDARVEARAERIWHVFAPVQQLMHLRVCIESALGQQARWNEGDWVRIRRRDARFSGFDDQRECRRVMRAQSSRGTEVNREALRSAPARASGDALVSRHPAANMVYDVLMYSEKEARAGGAYSVKT